MTFKVTVRDPDGQPVNDVLVAANDLMTGGLYSRSTAAGYADVAMFDSHVGDHVTLWVQDPQMRYSGLVLGDALIVTKEDQVLELVVVPFG